MPSFQINTTNFQKMYPPEDVDVFGPLQVIYWTLASTGADTALTEWWDAANADL